MESKTPIALVADIVSGSLHEKAERVTYLFIHTEPDIKTCLIHGGRLEIDPRIESVTTRTFDEFYTLLSQTFPQKSDLAALQQFAASLGRVEESARGKLRTPRVQAAMYEALSLVPSNHIFERTTVHNATVRIAVWKHVCAMKMMTEGILKHRLALQKTADEDR